MVGENPCLNMSNISIASDYSVYPVGRFPEDSEFNGEQFREKYLVPALQTEPRVVVNIDGTEGYGSSFLEEAFGGLVRKGYFTAKELLTKLVIEYRDPDFGLFEKLIWKHIKAARRE